MTLTWCMSELYYISYLSYLSYLAMFKNECVHTFKYAFYYGPNFLALQCTIGNRVDELDIV